MGGEASFAPLGSLVDKARGISYGVVQPGQHVDGGIPIVRVTDIRYGRINQNEPLRIAPEIAEKHRRTALRGGELLLTLVGTVGETAVVPASLAGWNTARAVAVLPVLDEPGSRWIQYALQTGPAREYIQTRLNTTVQATLNLGDVTKLPIPLPPLAVRERILSILGALDDKIELNRKMNATLEAMARALFKSWFVDFDPVRAKAEGRAPSGMDAETAKQFSSELVDSDLGMTPKGWCPRTLGETSKVVMGQSPPGETYNVLGSGTPFFQGSTDFGFRFPSRRVFCTAPTRFALAGDTLVSVRAPVGKLNMAMEGCAIGRGVASVRHRSNSRSFTYYLLHALQAAFEPYAAEGTVFGSINKAAFEGLRHVEPPRPIVEAFVSQAASLDERIEVLTQENATLARVRDALLPRLLSGELSVVETERVVEVVV